MSNIAKRRASAQQQDAETYARRRREIIDMAARLFREQGYAPTSLNDIATALETDRASVYYYVSSKKELLHEVVRDAIAQTAHEASAISASDAAPADKLNRLIHALLRAYADNFPYQFVYIQEGMAVDNHGDKHLAQLGKQYEAALINIIKEGLDDESFRPIGDPKIIAYGLLGALNWTHRWFSPKGRSTPEQIADTFSQMMLGGLVAPSRRNHAVAGRASK